MSFTPDIIPVPTYLLGNVELTSLHERLWQFKIGDLEATNVPCERAAAACEAIEIEMIKRGRPIRLEDMQY